jgi:hypothetical protein
MHVEIDAVLVDEEFTDQAKEAWYVLEIDNLCVWLA